MAQELHQILEAEIPLLAADEQHFIGLLRMLDQAANNAAQMPLVIDYINRGIKQHTQYTLYLFRAREDYYAQFLTAVKAHVSIPVLQNLAARLVPASPLRTYLQNRVINQNSPTCFGVTFAVNLPPEETWGQVASSTLQKFFPFNRTPLLADAIGEVTPLQINSHFFDVAIIAYAAATYKTTTYFFNGAAMTSLVLNEGCANIIKRLGLDQKLGAEVAPFLAGLCINTVIDSVCDGGGAYIVGYLLGSALGKAGEYLVKITTDQYLAPYPKSSKMLQQLTNDVGMNVGYTIGFYALSPPVKQEKKQEQDQQRQQQRQKQEQDQQRQQQRQKQEQDQQRQQQKQKQGQQGQQQQKHDQQNQQEHQKKQGQQNHQKQQQQKKQPTAKNSKKSQYQALYNSDQCMREPAKCCPLALKALGFTGQEKKPSTVAIKMSFRKEMGKTHPDKCPTADCNDLAVTLNSAKSIILSNGCVGFRK